MFNYIEQANLLAESYDRSCAFVEGGYLPVFHYPTYSETTARLLNDICVLGYAPEGMYDWNSYFFRIPDLDYLAFTVLWIVFLCGFYNGYRERHGTKMAGFL